MQISPNELLKLLAEVARREVGVYKEKEKHEVKSKTRLMKIEVTYDFYDMENNTVSHSYNVIMTDCKTNAVRTVIEGLHLRFLSSDICTEYNPINFTYKGYKRAQADNQICVFEIRNIRDCVIDYLEL